MSDGPTKLMDEPRPLHREPVFESVITGSIRFGSASDNQVQGQGQADVAPVAFSG